MNTRNKYSYEFRFGCVEAVLKGRRSAREVAREQGFDESNLRLWIGFYEKYGKAGLRRRGKRQYDAAFKRRVLQAIDEELLSLRAACVRFNIGSESVIINCTCFLYS